MTEPELDALLKQPLADVAEDGFSRDAAAKIERRARAGVWFDLAAVFGTFLLIVMFVPLGRLVAPFETLAIGLALSLPFAIACGALALTYAMMRAVAD